MRSTSLYMGYGERSPEWGPGATPLVRGLGGRRPLNLTTFPHLKENSNNENCTLFGSIYAVNNVTMFAVILLVYKLDELINAFASIYAVLNIDAITL